MKDLKSKIYSWIKKSKKQKYSEDPATQDYLDGYNECLKDLELFLNMTHLEVGDTIELTEDVEHLNKGSILEIVHISHGSKQVFVANGVFDPRKSIKNNVISLNEGQYKKHEKG